MLEISVLNKHKIINIFPEVRVIQDRNSAIAVGCSVIWHLVCDLQRVFFVQHFLDAQKLPETLYSCILITKYYPFSHKLTFSLSLYWRLHV